MESRGVRTPVAYQMQGMVEAFGGELAEVEDVE